MRVVVEIPESRVVRLRNAYQGEDPELLEYLSQPFVHLTSYIESSAEEASRTRTETPLKVLERVCSCFHQVVKRLQNRHAGRQALEINDEYDVQDLLAALLSLYFEDVRREEWIPSYAGKAARADFLLKAHEIVIEVKRASNSLKDGELHDQLLVDIAHYRKHPDCRALLCFVYDPLGCIKNPAGIENDLNSEAPDFRVIVRITPKGY